MNATVFFSLCLIVVVGIEPNTSFSTWTSARLRLLDTLKFQFFENKLKLQRAQYMYM